MLMSITCSQNFVSVLVYKKVWRSLCLWLWVWLFFIIYLFFYQITLSICNWTRYLTYHTDWIHYVHILYPRVPTLKNILMTGNQWILSQHLNIRVNSYFTFIFINQRVLKWSPSIYDLTSYLIYPTDNIYYLKFIILFFIIGIIHTGTNS